MKPELEVAWVVRDDDGHGAVVFADNEPQAQVNAENQDDICGDLDDIDRAPRYDKYRPGPVPVAVLLEDGWYFECWFCGHQVTNDGCDDCAKPRGDDRYVPVCTKTMVFCSRHCRQQYREEQERHERESRAAVRSIRRMVRGTFPGAKVIKTSASFEKVAGRNFSGVAEFSFPGSLGTAKYHENRPKECYVQNRDLEAWAKWRGEPVKIVEDMAIPMASRAQQVKP